VGRVTCPRQTDRGKLENSSLAVLVGRRIFQDDVTVQRAADRFRTAAGGGATAVTEVCRKAGISEATYYVWRKKFGGLMPSEMKRLKQLEEENGKLKKLVADLSLDKAILQDVLSKNV
jgi:putative transposase